MMTDDTSANEDSRLATSAAISVLKDYLGPAFIEFADHYAEADHELFATRLGEIAADLKSGGNGGVY